MTPSSLIDVADTLLSVHTGRPRQANLKRAVSTIYLAMLHAMGRSNANSLVGTTGADRSEAAWLQMYRSIEHGLAKAQCENTAVMSRFPAEIQIFAANFVELQKKRVKADYDPSSRFRLADVQQWLEIAKLDIARLEGMPMKHRRAFAVWVTTRKRG